MTPLLAMHSMNRTSPRHYANGAHISSHIPAVPQQEVYTQASYTIPASCACFSHLKPLHMLFGASGMHDLYFLTCVTWNLANSTTASRHALYIHYPYSSPATNQKTRQKISFIIATKPRKHLGKKNKGKKTLLKDIKEDLSKWSDTSCLFIERLIIV